MSEIKLLLWGLEGILIITAIFLAGIWFGWKMAVIVLLVIWASSAGANLRAMDK